MRAAGVCLLLFCGGAAFSQTITYKADTTTKSDTIPPASETESIAEPRESSESGEEFDHGNRTIRYYETIPPERNDDRRSETRYYVRRKSDRSDIKTLSGSVNHSGGFGAISFRSTDFRGETMVLGGVRGGWIVNRTLGIGLEAHGIIPTAKFTDIVLNERVVALGGYGGLFLEPIFFSNQVVHITFPISAGSGWLGYHYDWEDYYGPGAGNPLSGDLVEGDVFWYVEPGVDLEINIALNFRLALGVSKRFTQDLDLQNTEQSDFDGLNYFLTLKIGGF